MCSFHWEQWSCVLWSLWGITCFVYFMGRFHYLDLIYLNLTTFSHLHRFVCMIGQAETPSCNAHCQDLFQPWSTRTMDSVSLAKTFVTKSYFFWLLNSITSFIFRKEGRPPFLIELNWKIVGWSMWFAYI